MGGADSLKEILRWLPRPDTRPVYRLGMDARPLSEEELDRLSEKAGRLAIEMRKRNPTQGAWDSLRWLEEAVRQKQIQRNRILAIDRVLKSFDIQ